MKVKTTKAVLAFFTASALALIIQTAEQPKKEIYKPVEPKAATEELKEKKERKNAHFNKSLIDAKTLKRRLDNLTYTYTYQAEELEELGGYYITAYCNCSKCCTYANQATASGVFPHYEEEPDTPTTCAIDPKLHSFGEVFLVDGKTYIAEDTGSAVKGRHLDLFFEDHSAVESFGSYYTTVYAVNYYTEERKGKRTHGIDNYLLPGGWSPGDFLRDVFAALRG